MKRFSLQFSSLPSFRKPSFRQPVNAKPKPSEITYTDGQDLRIFSLNLEYYREYCAAEDKLSYELSLKKRIKEVDVLCVREDLLCWSNIFLEDGKPFSDFERIVSSIDKTDLEASSLKDMIYEDDETTEVLRANGMNDEELSSQMGNSIYLSKHTNWTNISQKVIQISSHSSLPNLKPLAYRSVVCVTLSCHDMTKPIQVLCTQLSGGSIEDSFISDARVSDILTSERIIQMQKCLKQRDKSADNVLVGGFNGSVTRTQALDEYLDILREKKQNVSSSDYYSYMMAPFTTLAESGSTWNLLYRRLGNDADYFVTSPHMVVKKVKETRFQIQMRDMRFNAPAIMQDIKAFTNQTLTDISGEKVVFFHRVKSATSAVISYNDVKSIKWSRKMKEVEAIIRAVDEESKSNKLDLAYPLLEYTDSNDGPMLLEKRPLIDAINEEQKTLWTNFLKNPSFDTFGIFMKFCAVEEEQKLIEYGWNVEDNWYSIEEYHDQFMCTEQMTAAHKSIHGLLLGTRILRGLLKANMLQGKVMGVRAF